MIKDPFEITSVNISKYLLHLSKHLLDVGDDPLPSGLDCGVTVGSPLPVVQRSSHSADLLEGNQ